MQDAIEAFADHVINTESRDIADEAWLAAKTCILDTFGVGLAGSTGPYVRELLNAYPTGGPSRVLGQKGGFAPADAALLNGYQIHNSEFDCVHEKAVIHTMTVLMSVLLAEADRRGGIDGKNLIRASILGVDVACNLGVACTTGLQFFRPATAGTFAAIAAMGAVRRYDKDTLLRAFALGYSQLCGTMQAHTEGSPILALQIGLNARNAVTACDLAEHGLPGLTGVLEGPFGFFGLFEKAGDIRSTLPTLGKTWRIAEVAHKPFPSGRATHGIVDAIQELQRENEIDAAAIVKVEARVPSLTNHLIGRPVHDAMEINYARLNGQYAASVMLSRGFIGIDDFTIEAVREPARVALARKVVILVNENPDPNALSPVDVDIHMADGTVHSKMIETVYGNPAKPMTKDAHLTKFRRNWAAAACGLKDVDAEVMINRVGTLETVPDIRELIDLATG